MSDIFERLEPLLATTMQILKSEGLTEAAELLRTASAKIEETGFDNWNGGTRLYTLYLSIPPKDYAQLGERKDRLESQIHDRLKPMLERFSSDWISVSITPQIEYSPDWRSTGSGIPRTTRQNILDGLRLEGVRWSGTLDDIEFLERIFELKSLPSYDHRFKDAAGDIWQHRINNHDWDDDWIFADRRFKLLTGPDDEFAKFLCETVHPVVRPDRDEALKLVRHFNDQLRPVGWSLVEEELIAGRPRFVGRPISAASDRSISRARSVADALEAGWMQKEIVRLEASVEKDPSLAIGTAKDLVEFCCKSILGRLGVDVPKSTDLPKLTKIVAKELKLLPDDVSEAAKGSNTIRIILNNLSALTQGLAELRGLYGSGHGRDGKYKGLEPRHARLP